MGGFHGDRFSFRGRDNTLYALLAARHFQVNGLFMPATFTMGGTCEKCAQKTVHGSFIKSIYFHARPSATNKTVLVEYHAEEPSHAMLTTVDAHTGTMSTEIEVAVKMPDVSEYTVEDVSVQLSRKHMREAAIDVRNGEFKVTA